MQIKSIDFKISYSKSIFFRIFGEVIHKIFGTYEKNCMRNGVRRRAGGM
jgi:hypothetical protein